MAAMERMSALPSQGSLEVSLGFEKTGLMEVQPAPPTGPRQTRQVATSRSSPRSGSTRNVAGTGMVSPSPPTSASLTTGVTPKADGVQAAVCEHR